MKHAAMALASVLLLFAVPALAHDCDCTAPDGSCSASVSCPEGCFAMCGENGQCSSGCSGGGPGEGGPRHDSPNPLGSPIVLPGSMPVNPVTFTATGLTGRDVADVLEDALGSDVRFLPVDPLETYSLDIIDFPADQLARAMAEFGVVAIADSPKRGALGAAGAQGAQVTIRLDDTSVGVVVGLLEQLAASSGGSIVAVDPAAPFNLEVQSMPLDELLTALEKMGAIRIE